VHWNQSFVPSFQTIIGSRSNNLEKSSALYYAVLALSSLNMSRVYPLEESLGHVYAATLCLRPQPLHFQASRAYYTLAIQRLAKVTQQEYRADTCNIQAAILLLYYMESSICNFEQTACHGHGLDQLLSTAERVPETEERTKQVMAIWDQARCYNWWIEFHFSSLDSQQRQTRLQLLSAFYAGLDTAQTRRAIVLSILCETYRITSQQFLHWWSSQNHEPSLPSIERSNLDSAQSASKLLETERERLDAWAGIVTSYPNLTHEFPSNDNSTPDKFEAIMDYIYYVATRLLQACTLENCVHSDTASETSMAAFWGKQLLQTVYGMKIADHLNKNAYTIGISGVLLAGVLRFTSFEFGKSALLWLQAQEVPEEGGLPLQQIISIVEVINEHREMGVDIHAIEPVREEHGRKGKLHTYDNQGISYVRLYGVEAKSGLPVSAESFIGKHIMLSNVVTSLNPW
jgi:hypothetical protein